MSYFADCLRAVREKNPLVHHLTNYVTVQSCANMTLAVGASPIMADDVAEAGDIAALASALVLNIGTLNSRTVEAMLEAGRRANAADVPVVLDPVGAGASRLRNETLARLLQDVRFTCVRGNLSEISFLAGLAAQARGVDVSAADQKRPLEEQAAIAQSAAGRLGCTAVISGAVDWVSDGRRVLALSGGHAMMARITGSGCMGTSVVGACCGAWDVPLEAAATAVAIMNAAGEMAHEAAGALGAGSFHTALLDAVSRLDGQTLEGRVDCRER